MEFALCQTESVIGFHDSIQSCLPPIKHKFSVEYCLPVAGHSSIVPEWVRNDFEFCNSINKRAVTAAIKYTYTVQHKFQTAELN